jgi:four helix bundle protein
MRSNYQNNNPIIDKSLKFAVHIVKFTDLLIENRKWKIAEQLLKSGTSIGANIREAQNAESKADFIHKMKISAKEIDETQYWLELIDSAYEEFDITELDSKIVELSKIVNSIIGTSKRNLRKNN